MIDSMRTWLSGMVVGALLCHAAPGWAEMAPQFDKGVELLKQLEYVRAIELFEKALESPANTAAQRARIHVQIGIARSGLTEYDAAKAAFKRALTEDRSVELPANTSPKIRALFEKVRFEMPAQKPVVPKLPTSTDKPSPLDAREDGDVDVEEKKDTGDVDSARSGTNWPAWITLGVGAAAGVAGLAMGLMNRSEKDKAEDQALFYNEAKDHADKAASYGTAANVLFGVAGAAALTSAVLFYLGHRKKAANDSPADDSLADDISAAVVPTTSGVVVQFGLRR